MISDLVDLLFSFYWEFDNACIIFPVDSFKCSSQFPLQRKWKRSWVFSDNTGNSPTVTKSDEVSVVSDDEDSSQLREDCRKRRLRSQRKLRKFHDGIVTSPSLERAVSLIQDWNVINNVNTDIHLYFIMMIKLFNNHQIHGCY
jgi:hypothetical protein